jgi:formylglycine-generating enzyme required for sulfatase activity
MHGNVWEWCSDWYNRYFYGHSPEDYRVYRGGSWHGNAGYCRAAFRGRNLPSYRSINLGFRVVAVPSGRSSYQSSAAESPMVRGAEKPQPDVKAATEKAVAAQKECSQRRRLPVEITNSIGMKLKLIPAGEFMMGSHESAEEVARVFLANAEHYRDEHPQHSVRITRPFYLGAHEVTVDQFRRFVEGTSYATDAERDGIGCFGFDTSSGKWTNKPEHTWRNLGFPRTNSHPVVNVSWNDAMAFCQWLSRKESKTYRLPSEAEWEYACRGGTATRYWFGDDPEGLAQVDNVADTAKEEWAHWKAISAQDGYVFTAPVGMYRPNPFGLYDIHGNVLEWCSDWYASDYYGKFPPDDPGGPGSGAYRVLRGGSWSNVPGLARSARRGWLTPVTRGPKCGFRLARTP